MYKTNVLYLSVAVLLLHKHIQIIEFSNMNICIGFTSMQNSIIFVTN